MIRREDLYLLFCLWMLLCAAAPWFNRVGKSFSPSANGEIRINGNAPSTENWGFSYWYPKSANLARLPLSAVETRFATGFPGEIARFADNGGVWVVRHVRQITRMLHPAADCYRGLGYQVGAAKIIDRKGSGRWRCILAERGQTLRVCERIIDAEMRQWTDVSSWYWENLLRTETGEWWAVTEVSVANPGSML
jgi:hypothetical protein